MCFSVEGFFSHSFRHIYQELRSQAEKMREKVFLGEEQVAEHMKQEWKAVNEMTAPGSGRPKSFAFEHQVRTVLASGCSARAGREQVLTSARVFLSPEVCTVYESMVPNTRWSTHPKPPPASSLVAKCLSIPYAATRFQRQREALGNEAWLYSMIEVARAKEVLQWGFDETSIEGTPTLNQWVLVPNGELAPRLITIQCAGIPNPGP